MMIKYFIEKERLNCLTRKWISIKKPHSDITFYPDMVCLTEQLPSLVSILNLNERLNILSIDDEGYIEYYFSVYKDCELIEHYDNYNQNFREV